MKVSIVIPVYRVAPFVERCLLSVLRQSWPDLEVLLVDDRGEDDSMRIVAAVLEREPRGSRVRILRHDRNRGLSAARNTGIREATGDYVFFLDGDDYLSPPAIACLAAVAARSQPDVVIGGYCREGDNRQTPLLTLGDGTTVAGNEVRRSFYRKQWYVMAWNKLVRRQFLLDHRLFFREGIVHEDDLWSFFLAQCAGSIVVTSEVTYHYVVHAGSISALRDRRHFDCCLRVLSEEYDYLRAHSGDRPWRESFLFLENAKADYFDHMLFYSDSKAYCRKIIRALRRMSLLPPLKTVLSCRLPASLRWRLCGNLLPLSVAHIYLKAYLAVTNRFGIRNKDFPIDERT